MYKSKIFTVGKTKETWLHDALSEYTKRLQPTIEITWVLAKNNEQLESFLDNENSFISLDPEGMLLTSEKFSTLIHKKLEMGGSRINFVIGAAEGLTPKIKARSTDLLSLSPLTFTHQLTRLILLEQLYRGFEIQKGSPYHK
ncbi:MAG: 23S rRNA (pseudouridine(1915)-N(3))-methyltransferase RlmH [Chlamydiae bacterium]|nr:23S rRNA (pseudouridine(1915)-N(3))-methyltransferase RlmH [Chlamydiota bacterium]